jgi:predicted Fe-Mo cluster-binding NifX family protein
MRVCLPTEVPGGIAAALAGHFGSAPTFTIIDTESESVEILTNTGPHAGENHDRHHGSDHHAGHGGGCRSARIVAGKMIDAVICGSIGRNAMKSIPGARFYVAVGGTAGELVAQLQQGTLAEQTEGCGGHHEHHHSESHA